MVTKKLSSKQRVLTVAIKMFLENGYKQTTMRELAKRANVNYGSLTFAFKSKENVVCQLLGYVFEYQFSKVKEFLKEKANDKILFYATEMALQINVAESSEHLREMYNVSYSMPNSSQVVFNTITTKLEDIFKEFLPQAEKKDFYELEIASAGVMRNFISVPCDVYFTMERKIKRLLETTFLIYRVPQSKIDEALNFVSTLNFEKLARETLKGMNSYIENRLIDC